MDPRKTVTIADRLARTIGAAGGFGPPAAITGSVTSRSLSRRVNTIGDRYLHLLEAAAIEHVLTTTELMEIANVVAGPWRHNAASINGLAGHIADSYGLEPEEVHASQAPEAAFVKKIAGLTALQRVAAIEWVERHLPDLDAQ